MGGVMFLVLLCLSAGTLSVVQGEDPYFFFTWNVTYGTISPLGVPQQAILINGEFPGPNINSTSNNNIVINVFNNLDEPFLLTWNGIQQRKNSWQDGVPGTNCPILPGTNYTYHFQVKDQIGSYFYYPTTAMHRAAGGFGGLRVNSRLLIPVPYADPEDDYTVLIGDWYTKSHSTLRNFLDSGRSIGRPDGVLINGKNAKDGRVPHRPKHITNHLTSTSANVSRSLSLPTKTPRITTWLPSTRFTKTVLTGKGIIRYTNGKGPASPEIPEAPVGWAWSLNQFRSFRWNLTASAARPNPQGSYHYGSINITRTIKLVNSASRGDGKLRYAINGASHVDPDTPLKLAEYYGVADKVFKYDTISDEPPATIDKVTLAPNVLNVTFRNFIEIIFENHEKSMQSWHLDGYSFFAVAIEPGRWTPEKRKNYNLLDAVSRHTVQVFPKSWAAIMLTFDNAGMWNLRSELSENRYLGQQLYISVISPARSLRDEYNLPEDTLLCGHC
ncbi:L-ascorbate oxidase-like [Quillaja saponaria]|uniref:L-ascorbate oxidase-like n=1 Tax=Quillaja saponaria TaxID=32244 RepID=A0AAD7LC90_QUISA|nr:L-ascorbate oxidase-like [Quillaja saponaria]